MTVSGLTPVVLLFSAKENKNMPIIIKNTNANDY